MVIWVVCMHTRGCACVYFDMRTLSVSLGSFYPIVFDYDSVNNTRVFIG